MLQVIDIKTDRFITGTGTRPKHAVAQIFVTGRTHRLCDTLFTKLCEGLFPHTAGA